MSFDYSMIPDGHYDLVLTRPDGMRKFWHYHKFESVLRYIPQELMGEGKSILDLGCFAGSFLGLVPENMFSYQLGMDILPNQIAYAQKKYGTNFREFKNYEGHRGPLEVTQAQFDVVTLIEVIEHLNPSQIHELMLQISKLLRPGGCLIITTPNYTSTWPLLEFLLNHFSDIKYEEQHFTKFNYFGFKRKMQVLLQNTPLQCQAMTTSHFLAPFVAPFSYRLALEVATKISSAKWKNPFGNIILSRWVKK